MFKATVNAKKNLEIAFEGEAVLIDGKPAEVSRVVLNTMRSHVLLDGRSMNAEVVEANAETKEFVVKVNNRTYQIQLKDRFDELLKSLGMEAVGQKKMSEVKAPMPGMVLNILVHEGEEVEKDKPLLILEAMKMENVIKSAASGKVKKVKAVKGVAVEKGEVLIEFE